MDADHDTPRLSGAAVFFHVFLPFALGHYLSSLLRNVNAVLAPQLVGALALTPGQLGLLTSAFFFAFALVQLPVGIALDRYGPRRVQLLLMLLAAGGTFLFATGQSFVQLVVARAIIGCGLGGCFMSAVKAVSRASIMNRPRQSVCWSSERTGIVAEAAPSPPTAIR